MPADKIFQDVDFYDPSLEYPGFDSDDEVVEVTPSATPQGCFRLVVQSSEVLARRKRLAVLEAYTQIEIGRDLSSSETEPRIRLKDMEVSKVHATLFWEEARAGWAIVDMGSKHGTFLTPARTIIRKQHDSNGGESSSSSLPTPIRLSPSRQASFPRALAHGDLIIVGTTSFVVHIHEFAFPCEICVSDGENEIVLFPNASGQRRDVIDITNDPEPTPAPPVNPRIAMRALKKQLLSQHTASLPNENKTTNYMDRSAMRRTLQTPYAFGRRDGFPSEAVQAENVGSDWTTSLTGWNNVTPPSATGPSPSSASSPNFTHMSESAGRYFTPSSSSLMQARTNSLDVAERSWPAPSSYRSSATTPISSSNVGHGLLAKLGWKPGTALGVAQADMAKEDLSRLVEEQVVDVDAIDELLSRPPEEKDGGPNARKALVEPLQAKANFGRSGLGMHPTSSAPMQTFRLPPPKSNPNKRNNAKMKGRAQTGIRVQSHERSWADIRRELE